ncbi:MAG TPA: protein kinase [Ktedonobacterales bacterium]|nr:protein kinase [Ktedonobacterales bacterium]
MSGLTGLQGTRLGDYELMEPIGEGGMAEVYRARQCTAFGREVALKVIRPEFTRDEPFRRRFLREAHVIARLSHPHILPLIEFGDEQGTLYLVMPLVREGTLRDLLKDHQTPLSLEEALPLFVPLCDAVEYAHQEGIIHRDIKPQNILLQLHTHVLLADFGIARDRFDTKMTITGGVIGSVEYMAPEQAEGQEDARSDIYSLGIVLYQLLTGAVPYSGSMPLQVLFKKAHDPLPDPRKHNPNLPAELADILHIALAKDPQKRFASAGALGEAVEQIMPHAVPPSLQYQMPWWHNPYAPAPHDFTSGPTQRIRSDQPSGGEALAASDGQHLDNAPTTPVPASSAPTFLYISQPSLNSLEGAAPSDWATRSTLHDEDWQNAQPGASRTSQRARLLPILLVSSLAVVLLLTLCVSSVASGRVGLAWLHIGSATTGSQLLTPTPGATIQPTQLPSPISTVPSWPPVNNDQPTSPAAPQPTTTPATQPTTPTTPQPTVTASPQPSQTATPVPTDTPAPQPTAPSTPAPTDTPAPQPTDTPQPAPTQGPGLPPVTTPGPDPQGATIP